MTGLGQTLTSADVCDTTASPPKADMTGSPSDVAEGPQADMALAFLLRQRLCHVACVLDEELRGGAEHAVLDRNDPNGNGDKR
jgi:hypothetical protein